MSPRGRGRGRGRGRPPLSMSSKMEFLSNELKVEVSSDEEGFKGAWYLAKIIVNSNSAPKRKNLVWVQYEDLLSDTDPNNPLIECVDSSLIRPRPPPPLPDQTYEPHDVVDAFHRDGWWKGVVTKIQVSEENQTSYNVVFETPPEHFTFSSADLRFHLEWSDGQWVRPPKQERMKGLEIFKGMHIEANLQDAWFPAIVVDEVGFNSFLVENDHNHMEETIDSFHVRTLPPNLEVQKFEMLEVVDAFHDSCWRTATITKILTDGRYEVRLKSLDKKIKLIHSKIRPHLLWTNGRWVSLSKEIPNEAQCEEQSADVDNTAKHSSVKKLRKKSTPLGTNSTSNKLNKAPSEREETLTSYSKKLRMENSPNHLSPEESHPVCDSGGNLSVAGFDQQEAGEENGKAESSKGERELNAQVRAADKKNTDPAETTNQIEHINNDSDSSTRLAAFSGPYAESSFHLPHEEINIQKESNAFGQQDKGEEHNVSEGTASEMDMEVCAVPIADDTTKVVASCDTVNDDLALSTCLGRDVENLNQPYVINVQASSELVEKQELPFTKSTSLWQHVDSLEVFKWLPQNPHFSPLLEENEITREGFAIGSMLNFAGLVGKVSKLKIETPRSVFDRYLEALRKFEMHGFDVKEVVERINKMLSIKIREEEMTNESKSSNSKLAVCVSEQEKLEEEMNAIQKRIRELEEQRAKEVEERVTIDSKINLLQKKVDRMKEELLNMELDFERKAGAPW
ncbi:DUF724 domain-containing protein 2-like isoform X2 [Euphorbia lathyris]|uniref:DUF724 domain-containing protein 2-like isoform X2 n=1 Tax=Euphorbia lathyris TaxID=212925 RepID=UPI003313CECD